MGSQHHIGDELPSNSIYNFSSTTFLCIKRGKSFSPEILTYLSVQLEEGDVVVERLRVVVVVDVGGGHPQSLGAL